MKFVKTVSNNNKDSSSNYYTNPLSQRMNKSLNQLIKSNKFIDGSSKEYDYINSNYNDDNNDKIVYAHYSYQVKGKYDCDDISSEIRKNKITFNENDYKRILKNVYSNDFFPKHNINNNNNNIYQIFQIRNSEKKNSKNSKNKKISQKKLITKKSSNNDKGNSNKKIKSKTNNTNNTSNKSNIINKR